MNAFIFQNDLTSDIALDLYLDQPEYQATALVEEVTKQMEIDHPQNLGDDDEEEDEELPLTQIVERKDNGSDFYHEHTQPLYACVRGM
jgi:hypothetical protein